MNPPHRLEIANLKFHRGIWQKKNFALGIPAKENPGLFAAPKAS
jgi:hypothetical protein